MITGVDVGGTRIKAAAVDENGNVIRSHSVSTPDSRTGVVNALRKLIAEVGGPGDGVGFGCKGIIDPATTRIDVLPGTLSFLEGDVLSELAGVAVTVAADNDARAAMAGEIAWGAARGCRDALMLTLGTGVGGAILAGGKLIRGAWGVAGHLGHITVNPDGPPCICGSHGCLETLFSARTIEAEAFAAAHRGCVTQLTHTSECSEVFRLAGEGDVVARLIVDRAVHALGAAMAGLAHALDPELIIVGGQISEAGEALLEPLRIEIAWRTKRLLRREIPLVRPKVREASGVVGAAALVLERMRLARS